MSQFEIGKTYRKTDKWYTGSDLDTNDTGLFTCHELDNDGDCWSDDLIFCGGTGRYCAASYRLEDGECELVSDS